MTIENDLRKQFMAAWKAADDPIDEYHEVARRLVNIERQSYYGDESSMKRLSKFREEISRAVKEGNKNEV
ncbi:hypothetical protein L1D44_21570 [Shewanella sp. Isolate13]|uniref:hypothetical protein n=1 Tax=Shewanella sp. Isolate13 TaxID=2908531 RepID=UPI001EFE1EAE|nr:hypothetical protein [Shewanella sp. Isolate13]MCG9732368.1 hypothetical protein [Shewanella sp. Isolate13]